MNVNDGAWLNFYGKKIHKKFIVLLYLCIRLVVECEVKRPEVVVMLFRNDLVNACLSGFFGIRVMQRPVRGASMRLHRTIVVSGKVSLF